MKDFVYNTTLGRMFFAEFGNFVHSNGINGRSDFYDDVFMVMFEEYFTLSNDLIMALCKIAYRFDLLVEFRADNNSVVVEFSKN
jgi:hypothetical protein